MFTRKTTFIIGAGASNEVGLPTGLDLKRIVADKLNITFDISHGYSLVTGDHAVESAIRAHVKLQNERDINPYLDEAWKIRDAMPQALSIDNYLDAHAGNEALKLCGKLAIARSIVIAQGVGQEAKIGWPSRAFEIA